MKKILLLLLFAASLFAQDHPPASGVLYRYGAGGDGSSPIDPGTLSPDAHYNEDGNDGSTWEDNITDANFEFKSSGITQTTINSINAWTTNGVITNTLKNVTGTASFPALVTDADHTWFFVMSANSGNPNHYPFQFPSTGAGNYFGFYNGTTTSFNWRDNSNNTCQVTATMTSDQVYVIAILISNVTGAAVMDIWVDGVKGTQGTQSTFTAINLDVNATCFNLVAGNSAYTGKWAEIVWFKSALTENQIERVSAFLVAKWIP
jgi:hypothetical protein